MITSFAGTRIERVRHPEITPLEIADLRLGADSFCDRVGRCGLHATLQVAIATLHAGDGATLSDGPLPSSVAGFDAVFLAGGRIAALDATEPLPLPWPAFRGGGAFAGMPGGFDLLRARDLSGWVLDIGQSQVKLASPNRQWQFVRDFTRLPSRHAMAEIAIPIYRRRLRDFLALNLQFAMHEAGEKPGAIIAALPSRLSEDGVALHGDYAGMAGYTDLLPDVLLDASLPTLPVLVLNDAELAAASARIDPRLAAYPKILVLTLGFGIGAALVSRSGRSAGRRIPD